MVRSQIVGKVGAQLGAALVAGRLEGAWAGERLMWLQPVDYSDKHSAYFAALGRAIALAQDGVAAPTRELVGLLEVPGPPLARVDASR